MANQPIKAGKSLISLPWSSVISTLATSDYPDPSNFMLARKILKLRASGDARYQIWLSSLPSSLQLCLPNYGFSEAELAACGDEYLIFRANYRRRKLEMEAEVFAKEGGGTEGDFIWAANLANSRCFRCDYTDHVVKVLPPGIDMRNDSCTPTAKTRFLPNGDYYFLPMPAFSRYELVAGDAGIRKGEEITLTYTPGLSDAEYYHSFGFLPDDNPYQSIQIFHNAAKLNESLTSIGLPVHLTDIPGRGLTATRYGLEPYSEQFVMLLMEHCLPAERVGGILLAKELWWRMMWEVVLHRSLRMLDEHEAAARKDPAPGDMSANMRLSVELRTRQLGNLRDLILVCRQKLSAITGM